MRRIYLTRERSFVGCLAKQQVYIEDHARGEVELDGIPCRRIAELANGETVDFAISEESRTVFVIATANTRKYCGEKYLIAAGDTDVELVGKNVYNPGLGNPFRFHGVTDEDALADRRRENKKGIMLTAAAVLVGLVFGLAVSGDKLFLKDKSFISDSFEIVLNTNFSDSYENGVYYFGSKDCSVAVYEYGYSDHVTLEEKSVSEFLEVLKENGSLASGAELSNESGVDFIEIEAESVSGELRSYLTVPLKGEQSFFIFEFGCKTKDYPKLRASFIEWASTIIIK